MAPGAAAYSAFSAASSTCMKRQVPQDASLRQAQHPGGERGQEVQVVQDGYQSMARRAGSRQQRCAHVLCSLRIQCRCRLVREHQARSLQLQAREAHLLAFPAGESISAHGGTIRHAQSGQGGIGVRHPSGRIDAHPAAPGLPALQLRQRPDEHVLARAQAWHQVKPLHHHTYLATQAAPLRARQRYRCIGPEFPAEHLHPTPRGAHHAGEQPQQRALARPVGSDDGHALAGGDRQAAAHPASVAARPWT